ncbi:hypothetical protein COL8621_01176 [Actibacterium lipolyticum]|uniref:Uncharacterized protein n=1 Tax=Actibacterium lipolyticum TaxID=1524263 RepID=A0A238JVA7_9RHOB|nr:hypothetical protein COL8621_01176 [Actibacterium lipolyticum]
MTPAYMVYEFLGGDPLVKGAVPLAFFLRPDFPAKRSTTHEEYT